MTKTQFTHKTNQSSKSPTKSLPHGTDYAHIKKQPIACSVINADTGVPEEYPALIRGKDKEIWKNSYGNDICRLAQGMPNRPDGTNTIHFIKKSSVPPGKKVTYGKKECTVRPTKAEKYRVRLTVGGDKLPYHGLTATQCASLITTKILLNSVVSTPKACWGYLDIKKFLWTANVRV